MKLSLLPLLALACLLSCGKKEEKEPEAIAPVQVTAVRQDTVRRTILADAILFPRDQASVMPKISAPVRKFYVNRGDHVKAGQLLATLENRDLAAAAAESKGQYEQAQSNLRSTSSATVPEAVAKARTDVEAAKQAMDAAEKVLQSRQKLLAEGALARRLVDDAQVSFVQARSTYQSAVEHMNALQNVGRQEQVKSAEAQAAAARAHNQAAEVQLSYSEVRSPISGVITDRPTYAGEMAQTATPLLTIMDVSRIVARANVPQQQALSIKVGQPASINAPDSSDVLQGKVTVVSPAVDPNSTTVQVWIEAPNPGERWKPGFTVRVGILTETIANAIVVPPEAVLPGSEGGSSVMVVTGDAVAHEHKVQLGVRDGDKVQLLSGAKPGDSVITLGGVGLSDGAKVRVLKPGEKLEDEKDEKDDKGKKKDDDDKDEKKSEKK